MLGGDCSRKPADDREVFNATDLPPGHEAPTDFLPPLVLEFLASPSPKFDDFGVGSSEGPSTPFSTTDCTDLFKDSTLGLRRTESIRHV